MNIWAAIYTRLLIKAIILMKLPIPEVIEGAGSREKVGAWCKKHNYSRVLIVTDKIMIKLGLLDKVVNSLEKEGIEYCIYDGVTPNPSIGECYEAMGLGMKNRVELVIGFGGGSPMDAAKFTAIGLATKKAPRKTIGMLKVDKVLPILEIPTTAGTGSEVGIGAVISDEYNHTKNAMADTKLIPVACVYDEETLESAPAKLIAQTTMDSLTHAVEAYISAVDSKEDMKRAEQSVAIINQYIIQAYENPSDMEAKKKLMEACHLSGVAFNRMGVGYAHGIGHRLTGFYDYSHGEAISMILPYILRFNRNIAKKKLAKLAVVCNLGTEAEDTIVLADKFINRICEFRDTFGIPKKCERLKREDYDAIIKEAFKEVNTTYAVPKHMTKKDAIALLDELIIE